MEGVALGLRQVLDELRRLTSIAEEITVVGGSSQSKLWRQIFADVYKMDIVKTNIDQQTAALGAAALAAVGTGIWSDFSRAIRLAHSVNKEIIFAIHPLKNKDIVYIKIGRLRP